MPVEHYGEHHQFLPRSHWLTAGEIRRVASLFVQLGVKKIRLTGGEPLLRRDILEIVESLASLEGVEDIALTTNGTRLAEQAAELKAAGLKRLTVSLDSLDERVFKEMNGGRGDLATVLAGIDAANRAGFAPLKINAVIERGKNDHTALDLVERFRGTGTIVRFIEYMDVGTVNGWRPEQVVPSKELLARIAARWPVEPRDSNYRGEVAKRYVFNGRAGRDRLHFVGQRAVLRRLPSSAALGRRHRLHMSVRVARHGAAQRVARGCERRGPRRAPAKRLAQSRRPLQRDPRPAARAQERRRRDEDRARRDVSDGRLMLTHVDKAQ